MLTPAFLAPSLDAPSLETFWPTRAELRGTDVEEDEGEDALLLERREAEDVVRGAAVGVGPEGRTGADEEEGEEARMGLAMGTAALGLEESKEAKKSSSGAAEAAAGATLVTPSMKRWSGNLRREEGGQLATSDELVDEQHASSSSPSPSTADIFYHLSPSGPAETLTDLFASSSFLLSSSSFQSPATREVYFDFPSWTLRR